MKIWVKLISEELKAENFLTYLKKHKKFFNEKVARYDSIGGNMGGQFNNNVNGPVKSSSQCPDGASGGEGGPSPSPSPSPRPSPSSGGGGGGALSGAKFIAGASSAQVSACTKGSKRCVLYFGASY